MASLEQKVQKGRVTLRRRIVLRSNLSSHLFFSRPPKKRHPSLVLVKSLWTIFFIVKTGLVQQDTHFWVIRSEKNFYSMPMSEGKVSFSIIATTPSSASI